MTNRVTKYAAMVESKVEQLGETTLDGTSWEDADAEMAITDYERYAYQTAQSRAFASGTLTQDEAMTAYRAIGEAGSEKNGNWPANTTYAMKVAITALMGELVTR
jgi:thiaminase